MENIKSIISLHNKKVLNRTNIKKTKTKGYATAAANISASKVVSVC